jgi:DNA-binding phage protein
MKVRSELWVRLPTFAVQVLRRRAEEQLQTVSGILESLVCDSIGTDEVRAMASESEGFARLFGAWLRHGDPEPGVTLPSGWRVRLRQAVRESGKTQNVIAREASMTPETLSRILSAEHVRPSFESIAQIARASGVSLGWIMEEPSFSLTDEQRAKVRTVGVLLLNLTGGLPKS